MSATSPSRRYSLGLALALVSSLPAHTRDATDEYWPFKVGNTWTFRCRAIFTSSAPTKTETWVSAVTLDKVKLEAEGINASMTSRVKDGPDQLSAYRIGTAGLFRTASPTSIDPPLPIMLFPVKPGKKWNWEGSLPLFGQRHRATAAVLFAGPEDVATATGILHAARIDVGYVVFFGGKSLGSAPGSGGRGTDEIGLPMSERMWFAPGVGLVKHTFVMRNVEMEEVLQSYSLK